MVLATGVPKEAIWLYYYIQRKIFFRATIFLHSPCPNLEGIKDALSYKFRRVTIDQNSCAVCTNEVARAKQEGISALCHGLVVDSTFERSENIATVSYSLAYTEGCGLHHDCSMLLSSAHAHCTNWH